MKAKDLLKENHPPSVMIYGPAGSGKTALVSQASSAYLMDFDDGMRTAITLKDKFTNLRQSIDFDVFVDRDPVNPDAYMRAKNKMLRIRSEAASNKWPYKGIVIDSLTGLVRAIQLHVMKCAKNNALAKPTIQQYGDMVNEVESILTIMRALPVVRLVTAHEMSVETDSGTLIRIMSATRPHGMNKIPWLFDEVLHSSARPAGQGKMNYIVSGRSSSVIATRTRSGITDDFVINDVGLEGLLSRVGYKLPGSS